MKRTGVIGILVVRRIADGLSHSIHDVGGRGHIGVADSERNHIDTLFGEGCFLGIDLGKQVGGKVVQAFGSLHGAPFVEMGWWQVRALLGGTTFMGNLHGFVLLIVVNALACVHHVHGAALTFELLKLSAGYHAISSLGSTVPLKLIAAGPVMIT